MSVHGGDVFFDIKANDQQFDQTMSGLEKKSNSAIGKLGKSFAVLGVTATAALTATFSKLTKDTIELGDHIDKMSQKMGMSNKAYQEWSFIADIAGTNIDSLKASMKTLATAAANNNSAFARLGITAQELSTLTQEQLFERVIQGLQGISSTTERTYLAGQLLGRGATELAPLLNMSAQEVANLKNRVAELGIMSDQGVYNCAAFRDAVTELKLAWAGIGHVLAEYVVPILTAVIKALTSAVLKVKEFVSNLFESSKLFQKLKGSVFDKKDTKQIKTAAAAFGDVDTTMKSTTVNTKKAKKEVQKLKRELLGFDKINKLTGEQGVSSDSGVNPVSSVPSSVSMPNAVAEVGQIDLTDDAEPTKKAVNKLKEILKAIYDMMPAKLQKAFSNLGKELRVLGENAKTAGNWLWEHILKPLGKWTIGEFTPAFVNALAAALRVFNKICEALGPVVAKLWESLFKPIAQAAGWALIKLLEALAWALNKIADFAEKHPKAFQIIVTGLTGLLVLKKLGGVLGILSKILGIFKPLVTIGTKLAPVLKALGVAFKALGAAIVAHPIAALIVAIAAAILLIWKNWDKIKNTKFGKFITECWNKLKQFGSYLKDTFLKIVDKVKDGADAVKKKWNALKSWWNGVKFKTKELKTKIEDKFQEKLNALKSKWKAFKFKTKNATVSILDKATAAIERIKQAWKDLKEMLSGGIVGSVKSFFTGETQQQNPAQKRPTSLMGIFNEMFNDVVTQFQNGRPKLADGGAVKRNTPTLAMIGDNKREGEIVAPDSKLQAMANAAAGGGNAETNALLRQLIEVVSNQNTDVILDGESIKRNVVKRINDHTRATGQPELIY